jgi:putative peptidoglycan lipid II flippase
VTEAGQPAFEADEGTGTVTRSVAGMGLAAAVSRAFGALRMVVIAAVLGTTFLGNTFQASNSVSNVLFDLLASGALSAVLIPSFVDAFGRGEQRKAEELAGGILSLALAGLGVVTLFGIVFAPALARLLTSGVADPTIAAQERALSTYLLRFFVPQILLYAVGAVSTAVLQARGRFALTSIAPIGNTVVLVASMVVFRVLAGSTPGLRLSGAERLTLALGGTLGVLGFIAVTTVGVLASGFRFHFGVRRALEDRHVRRLMRLSGWAMLQNSGVAILQAGALIAAGGLAGGVVAYQLAMVVFLAPYGILSEPIHTAVLPRLSADVVTGDHEGLRGAMRWAADAMAAVTFPVAALLVGLCTPVMAILAFGEAAHGRGPELLAAALGGLAIGIPAYGGFLLLTSASYALGDSRTPATIAITCSVLGAAGMIVAGHVIDGPGRLVAITAAHSAAQLVALVWLGWRLRPAVGPTLTMTQLRALVPAVAIGVGAWVAQRSLAPDARAAKLGLVAALSLVGLALYALALRVLRALPPRAPLAHRPRAALS